MGRTLNSAKQAKNDEFYTQLSDIEEELSCYKKYFKGKTIYCNCDDPSVSGFFHYFSYQFEKLGLKRLITTCYKNDNHDLYSNHDKDYAVTLEYTGMRDANGGVPKLEDIGIHHLKGDGDFRSKECIKLLKQADIVVTNPPFSLFREYVAQLVEHKKKFIIIGNKNAITYKEVFPLFKDNKMWLGHKSMGVDMLFDVTKDYTETLRATKKEGSAYRIVNGIVKGRASAIWLTNFTHKKRAQKMYLTAYYNPKEYPQYDNYPAINVDKVVDIPRDYSGEMGVPISFLDKFNPDQFEIIGADFEVKDGLLPHLVKPEWTGKLDRGYINRKRKYARIFIKNKHPEKSQ